MKIKRYKKVSRHMAFYVNNFGFRRPYQVLLDGTFCFAALNNKVNIADNIPRYLQNEVKILTTQCAVIEMENLGSKLNGALLVLKQYGTHKCGHEGKPIPGAKCLLSMVGKTNESHYIVASQDRDLQTKLRNIPGVPLLYLHSKTPVLDPPSEASNSFLKNKLAGLLESEKEALEELKVKSGMADEKKRAKKKKKGANPLSCLKKKKATNQNKVVKKEGATDVVRKKRKRIRIPEHVKQELMQKIKS